MDLACSLLPAPDKESQTQGRKGGHKSRRNAGAAGLSKHISDTSQVSLLQVYFSSAFSQKVSRKQLRGSFINVSAFPSAQALPLALPGAPHRDGQETVPRTPSSPVPGPVPAEGSGSGGAPTILKVSDGDIFDPGPANNLSWTPGLLAMGWPGWLIHTRGQSLAPELKGLWRVPGSRLS